MKKSTSKSKGIQASKGCMKISNFFNKQNNEKNIPHKKLPNNEPIEIQDSDEDSSLHSKKRKFEIGDTKVSPPLKKNSHKAVEDSAQPSTSGTTPNIIEKCVSVDEVDRCLNPSTSGITPIKNKPLVTVKSAEKLLCNRALIEYNSPEKVRERLIDQMSTKSPKKTILSPVKCSITPTKKSPKVSNGSSTSSEKTPGRRKTPKKLFEKSPNNLNEFNVEIIKKFVKITPSKSNRDEDCSRKSLESQKQNEMTPVKDVIKNQQILDSPILKVKNKLDFSDCSSVTDEKSKKSENSAHEKENIDLSNVDFNFDDGTWDNEVFEHIDYSLDLSQSQHCKIISIMQNQTKTLLTVKSTKTNKLAICNLQGFWMYSKLCIGDTIHITAKKTDDNNWLVDNQNGLLVYEPDLLISTTSVTGSIYCKRKCIFNEKFRGFDPTNKYMLVGCLVHALLQEVLKNGLRNLQEIQKCAQILLHKKETIGRIYESQVTVEFVEREMALYCTKIHEFVSNYMQNGKLKINSKQCQNGDWKGTITGIDDIEENIWCPDLGVKGKIDVSVKSGLVTMPLEVKTGRASVSLEHRAQVMLYIMMMTKLGYNVSSGLLLYIKEGILKEISMTPMERRDIMIMRNELAYYLSREPKVTKNCIGKNLEASEIPEPIDHPSCAKCPYNVLCVSHSRYANEDISTKKTLSSIHNDVINHLTENHINYFMRWSSMVSLEMNQGKDKKKLRDIYTVPAEERKNRGKCLIDLKIVNISSECNGMWEHTFEDKHGTKEFNNFLVSGLMENSYIVISVETRPAIASGFVTCITPSSITVCLDRDLNKKYQRSTFFLDTYESTAFQTYNLASLSLLLEMTDRGEQLRKIIVDGERPTFQTKLPRIIADKGKAILKRLNKVQQRAVLKGIAANEYMLIKGMPGTGKTSTIVALIQLLVELNKTILITSHTHSAVDNVCIKLVKFGVKLMRLGRESKVHKNLRQYTESYLTKDCKTPEELDMVYNSAQILAVTCFASGHPALSRRTLDFCIVDESTQVLQCSVIRPVYVAKTFILIGDPDQLPAVVQNRDALELGMSESLFERLNNDESRITLNLNYRMNSTITALANALTYNGELLVGSEHVANATLTLPKTEIIDNYKDKTWLIKALDNSLDNAVQFIDTGPVFNLENKVPWARNASYDDEASENTNSNIYEAALVYHLVQALLKSGVSYEQIGIIATYRAQVVQIVELLRHTHVDINTVDQFQGKDKNIVIYSCSKSKDTTKDWIKNKFELLEDKRRLNVAITRAKHKLIIVGDYTTLQNYSTFKKIASSLERNIIRLADTEGFAWNTTLDLTSYG